MLLTWVGAAEVQLMVPATLPSALVAVSVNFADILMA